MKPDKNSWELIVIKGILSSDQIRIEDVRNLETIHDFYFDPELYDKIVMHIKSQDWDTLKAITQENTIGFRLYLHLMKFQDQNNKTFVATIYDSDELRQDPEIIDLIPLL